MPQKKVTTVKKKVSTPKKSTTPKVTTKPKKKIESPKVKLLNQLKKLLTNIDEEGLVFLIQQAEIIKHNLEIDKLNNNIDNLNKSKKSKTKVSVSKSTTVTKLEIIPDDDKKNFIFCINGERKFITLAEMKSIVKICQSNDDVSLISGRLFQWLYNERKDVLIDGNIGSKSEKTLGELIKIIRSKFKTK